MVRILKSIPMVVMNEGVKESSLNRSRQHDLPTPESPMRSSLICGGQGQSGGRSRVERMTTGRDVRGNHSFLFLPWWRLCVELGGLRAAGCWLRAAGCVIEAGGGR